MGLGHFGLTPAFCRWIAPQPISFYNDTMTTYSNKLKSPHWQKMRLKVMQRDKFTCKLCKDTETTLNVHHKYYEQGKEPWEYPVNALVTLCQHCHENISIYPLKDCYFDDLKSYKAYTTGKERMMLHIKSKDIFVISIYEQQYGEYVYVGYVAYLTEGTNKLAEFIRK